MEFGTSSVLINEQLLLPIFLITELHLLLEFPLPPQGTPHSVASNSTDLISLSYTKEEQAKAVAFILNSVYGSFSSSSVISSHTRNHRKTQVWVEMMCFYGKKYSTTITKALQSRQVLNQ